MSTGDDRVFFFFAFEEGYNLDVLYFLELQNYSDGDCSHETKRHLLLGRKAMTNLDSVLKSRDITLPTEVCSVKAMVLPAVIYGCEN